MQGAMAKKIRQQKPKKIKKFKKENPPKKITKDLDIVFQCNCVKVKDRAQWDNPICNLHVKKGTAIQYIEDVNENSCLVSIDEGSNLPLHIALPNDVLA